MASKTLRVTHLGDDLELLPHHLLPQAVQHLLRPDAAVDCTRFTEDGMLYIQFFSHRTAAKIKEKYELPESSLKFDWSFTDLDLCSQNPPDRVSVVHVEAERDNAFLKVRMKQERICLSLKKYMFFFFKQHLTDLMILMFLSAETAPY